MPKILYFLSKLDKGGWKKFREFLSSPFFTVDMKLPILLDALQKHPTCDKRDQWEKEVFKVWKPQTPYDRNALRQSCTKLLELLKEYLGLIQYQQQAHLVNLHQVQGINQLGAEKYFHQSYQKAWQKWDHTVEERGSFDYWIAAQLFTSQINHHNLHGHRKMLPEIQEASIALDHYFWIQKAKFRLAELAQTQMFGSQAFASHGDNLLQIYPLLDVEADTNQLLTAYHLLLLAYENQEDANSYWTFKAYVQDQLHHGDREEIRSLISAAINYSNQQRRQGKHEFDEEFGDLYQILIEKDFIWINGKILAGDVMNLVVYHCEKKNFGWVDDFLIKCQKHLLPKQKEQAQLFCYGLRDYYKKNYFRAKQLMDQLLDDFDDVFYGINARIIKARISFEKGDMYDEGLADFLDAAYNFIRYQSISETHKKRQMNFFRYCRRLGIVMQSLDKNKALEKLKQEISQDPNVSSKQWLLAQIEERIE